jgi:hypothetical protein
MQACPPPSVRYSLSGYVSELSLNASDTHHIFRPLYRSLNAIVAQLKNSFGVNTAIEITNTTTTSKITGTLLIQNTPRQMPLLSDVAVTF